LVSLSACPKTRVPPLLRTPLSHSASFDCDENALHAHGSIFLFAHDLFGKPLHTFPDHALMRGLAAHHDREADDKDARE
jgi:hypothetical protein